MSVTKVQVGDTGALVSSGVSSVVLPVAASIGNCVLLSITTNNSVGSSDISTVTSPIGTFTRLAFAAYAGYTYPVEHWVCLKVTGASNSVTVTITDSSEWSAMAIETTPVSSASSVGAYNRNPSTDVIVSSIPAGSFVAVAISVDPVSPAGATFPSSPWSDYSTGYWHFANGLDVAYQSPTTSSVSAVWGFGSTVEYYSTVAAVLSPPGTSAPSAPTLTSPANASYLDASGSVTLGPATYNSTDADTQNAYALRIKTSGAGSYSYFNASTNALQSTIVWNPDSVSVGGSWSVTLPAGLVANGNIYNWSLASQESGANLQGPFATDYTFTSQAPPTLVVNSPSGTVNGTTEPGVSWAYTLPSGASQTNYQIIVESGTFSTTPGSGTVAWSSGVVSSSSTSAMVGSPLTPAVTYRVFVQVTETGGELSAWAYSTFTLQVDAPATPILTATPGNDPVTGAPMVTLTVQAIDNQLTANQASLESNATTGWTAGTNTTIAASSAWAQDGTYSLALTATAAGNVSATAPTGTAGVPCTSGETVRAMASFHSATTARSCTVAISFYTSSGALISTSTSTSATSTLSGNGGQAFFSEVAPASSAFMSVELVGTGLSANEVLSVDEILLAPGSSSTWTAGGFVGTTVVSLMFSDDNVNWFAVRNGTSLSIPVATQQVSVIDYEGPLGFTRYYQAQVVSG